MPNRFKDFTAFNESQINDLNTILEFSGVSVDVYRPDFDVEADEETGVYAFVQRILAHGQESINDSVLAGNKDVSVVKDFFTYITNFQDVRVNDRWTIDGVNYLVRSFNKANKNRVIVDLEKEN